MSKSDIIVLVILLGGVFFSIRWKKLTVPAALTGVVLGWTIYAGGGFTGLAMMTVFFILGTAATSWKKSLKQSIRGNAAHESTRTAAQVIANAGVAAISGLLIVIYPAHRSLLLMAMAGSLSAAAADTLASELGMVYGRRFYHILTGRPDEKGLDGVISLEGLLIGAGAAAVIALVYILGQYAPGQGLRPIPGVFLLLIGSGTLGNLTDSVLGAALERKGRLSNDAVNFCSTLAAALAAGALTVAFRVFTP
jgi:uncharacterized protein (TIGR00297 family)